jgi:hypothetical protein
MTTTHVHVLPPWESIRVGVFEGKVEISVETRNSLADVSLTAEQTDELIRALGAARVELSKARPRS